MYRFKTVLFFMLAIAACKKNNDTAIQQEPPAAIKGLIAQMQSDNPDCTCHSLLRQYIWNNENVYVLSADDALNAAEGYVCDWIPGYYNAKGGQMSMESGSESYQRFLNQSTFVKTVWVCR
ncbi:MAG: hypothetical protein QM763_03825 [Agriterribacter sp.]